MPKGCFNCLDKVIHRLYDKQYIEYEPGLCVWYTISEVVVPGSENVCSGSAVTDIMNQNLRLPNIVGLH